MRLEKIPRKLKKKAKKIILASYSLSYIKFKKLKLSRIRVRYYDKKTGMVGVGVHQ